MSFEYDRSEEIGDYTYFYKGNEIIAVYNPFVGLCKKHSNLKDTLNTNRGIKSEFYFAA